MLMTMIKNVGQLSSSESILESCSSISSEPNQPSCPALIPSVAWAIGALACTSEHTAAAVLNEGTNTMDVKIKQEIIT